MFKDNSKNRPNFLIIGANKGGTTSLFKYLGEHPEVFTPIIKEPMFFRYYKNNEEDGKFKTQKVIKSLNSYLKLFEGSNKYKAKGEASTTYLANPECAKNIFDFNPKMKLIVILRNPIERAFSNYLMYIRWRDEHRSFSQSIKDELNAVELPQGKMYIYLGHYLESLRTYFKVFNANQIKILLHEDLKYNPIKTYVEVCEFLNIDSNFMPDFNKRYNTNDLVEIRPVYKFLKRVNRQINFTFILPDFIKKMIYSKPKINKKDKQILIDIYKEEILDLSSFIKRDLSNWLK